MTTSKQSIPNTSKQTSNYLRVPYPNLQDLDALIGNGIRSSVGKQKLKEQQQAALTAKNLQAPYKEALTKPTAKPESRTLTFGDTTLVLPRDQHKLAALKQEALDYWKNHQRLNSLQVN